MDNLNIQIVANNRNMELITDAMSNTSVLHATALDDVSNSITKQATKVIILIYYILYTLYTVYYNTLYNTLYIYPIYNIV